MNHRVVDDATVAELLGRIEQHRLDGTWAVAKSHRTGFTPLDDVLEGGLRLGDLTLVGGPPGVGKTIATLQWGRSLALVGVPVVYVCYEHSAQALFGRLLTLEVGQLPRSTDPDEASELRRTVRAVASGARSLEVEVAGNLHLRAAHVRLTSYAANLRLIRAKGATGLDALREAAPQGGVLFVDYLQKVPTDRSGEDAERVIAIAGGLKDIAMDEGSAVVAVAAGDREGLTARRLRMHHLRGAAGLSYEADVVVMLNEKFQAVSRAHTAFDTVGAERFKQQVVFTVEKNRDGPAPVDVEFTKDFEHYRFVPEGNAVRERLVDDQLYAE